MASSNKLYDQVDALALDLLEKAKGGEVPIETQIDIFKEGIRWAAVKNRINPDRGEDAGGGLNLADLKREMDAAASANPGRTPGDGGDAASADDANEDGYLEDE